MVQLCDKDIDYHFYCVSCGTVYPVEMVIRYTFADENSRKFLAFTKDSDDNSFYVREYEGDLEERSYFEVKDREIINRIRSIIHDSKRVEEGKDRD